ncbi:hypothetical protein KKI95_14380 [Xenorhabdus bovienii]|uniref:hypothetical protein n=1 Tax=Xenorhabdus bovienii TaxID=40576 RepID=UPI0023B20F54|nr:hypothetical protein [Xenorhabdus bovienii]MDE9437082.1 hypothetical protein [Xenorhabdus bovienii]MDE9494750.1 hypothetical protein [Xenorhabdus bovienii]MDE9498725.1 hypothetical protein [Xenorhabdus bovienii]MDE9503099.1 hypothetical protein [Xenorhabdus bovienii]MDE9526892.1 hypothetical protein [Xenorhabdus bovienii]
MSQTLNEVVMLSNESGSFPLLADIQYLEPYTSSALNRKLKGILRAGIYAGFQPKVGSGLSVIITSTSEKDGQGAASINVGKSQISIQQVKDVIVPVPASKTSIIALEANFEFGKVTNQVDSSSTLKAAHIVVVDVARGISDNQLELCRVNVPMDAKAITESMIDTSHRLAQTVGITLSEKIDSDEEGIAANPKAVNVLRKTLLGDAPDGLNTIGQLAQAIGGNKNFIESISTALLEKMSKSANGADIPDKNAFINNLGLRDTVNKAENAYNKAETDSRVNDAKTLATNADNNANGRVPAGRKVNGKALTNDIALNAGDIGAYNRAETDSRVNDVRVLASEAKTAANNANGRVPDGRKVNGKALTNDIALNAGDVGAYNRAETDSRVNDVRVLANEAKTAANNANSNADGRVPTGRKVNGKALTNDIALNAGDVGAYNRAETDSRVNDVRVLVNEAKNAANNLINGIRLSAFRLYRIGSDRSEYANGNEDPLVIKYFGHPKMDGFSHVSARGRRRAGEVIVNLWIKDTNTYNEAVDTITYASMQYLINGNWVTATDDGS